MSIVAASRTPWLVVACMTLLGITACSLPDPVSRAQIPAFGTSLELTLIGVDRADARNVSALLRDDLAMMERNWNARRKDGVVARVNQEFNASSTAFPAPPSLLPLLRLSKSLSESSDDLFNPAIGHLVRAWGFQGRPEECLRPPDKDLIREIVRAKPSMRDVTLDGIRIASSNDAVKLDFRDIRMGYAMDQAMARLREAGIANASLYADGNVRAIGSRDGHPWTVAVRGPSGGGILATVKMTRNEAAFTVSRHQQNFTWQGEIFHDILDPRTGRPASGTASVTVLHTDASTADAAATALFVAGPREWRRIAKQMGLRYVMLADQEGRLHMTPSMHKRVNLQSSTRELVVSEPLT